MICSASHKPLAQDLLIWAFWLLHQLQSCWFAYGPRREKTCLRGFADNTGADQPAHLRRLISAFVIRFLESLIFKLATSENSIFLIVSVAGVTGLIFALSKTPKTDTLH